MHEIQEKGDEPMTNGQHEAKREHLWFAIRNGEQAPDMTYPVICARQTFTDGHAASIITFGRNANVPGLPERIHECLPWVRAALETHAKDADSTIAPPYVWIEPVGHMDEPEWDDALVMMDIIQGTAQFSDIIDHADHAKGLASTLQAMEQAFDRVGR